MENRSVSSIIWIWTNETFTHIRNLCVFFFHCYTAPSYYMCVCVFAVEINYRWFRHMNSFPPIFNMNKCMRRLVICIFIISRWSMSMDARCLFISMCMSFCYFFVVVVPAQFRFIMFNAVENCEKHIHCSI